MKLLWVKTDFLHPTTRGGQIRTLEILRWLHRWNEVHYVAFHDGNEEALRRSSEYASHVYPIPFTMSSKRSPRFVWEVLSNLASNDPVHLTRLISRAMKDKLREIIAREHFDALVCDFLSPCLNLPGPEQWVLFQHNVEAMILHRHVQHAGNPLSRWYYSLQAGRLERAEAFFCRSMRHVIAVSEVDEAAFRAYGVSKVTTIPTGVAVDNFTPDRNHTREYDLVFVGSMDWSPNIDAMNWIAAEILPLIRRRFPECSLAIVGRKPGTQIKAMAAPGSGITVTGTVDDVRPYLWKSAVSIVPIRIGGGTRLKIYEAMAAKTPVVSTTVGAEGLRAIHGENILIADTAADFAARCIDLLESETQRRRIAARAWDIVNEHFGWERIARQFEKILKP